MSCWDNPDKEVTIQYNNVFVDDLKDVMNDIVHARNHIEDNTVTHIIISADRPEADEISSKIKDRLSRFRKVKTYGGRTECGDFFYVFHIGKMIDIAIG